MNELSSAAFKRKLMQCFVTHVSVTSDRKQIEVWAQTDPKEAALVETLLEDNHNRLSDAFCAPRDQHVDVGMYFLTHMTNDLRFYRVVVTHVKQSEALVSFIDFGNEEWMPSEHLIEMNEAFAVNALAIKFILADVSPLQPTGWNLDQIKQLLDGFIYKAYNCEVIAVKDNIEYIRIYDQRFYQPFVRQLVDNGVVNNSLHRKYDINTANITNGFNECNGETGDEVDAFNKRIKYNDFQQNTNNLFNIPKSFESENKISGKDNSNCGQMLNEKIESNCFNNNSLFTQTSNLLLESQINKSNEKGVINTESYPIEENPGLIGLKKSIYICETRSSNSFYCQFSDEYTKLQELLQQMTEFYRNLRNNQKHSLNKADIKNNMLIAAKFSEDKYWYRGMVCSINGNYIEVFYIDYGNKESVIIDDCKELIQRFREAPHYAHHCSPVNRNLQHSILETIQSDVKIIECYFIKLIDNSFEVKLSGDCRLDTDNESNLMQEESEKLNEETSVSHIEFNELEALTKNNSNGNQIESFGFLIDGNNMLTNDFNVSNAQTYDEIDDAFNEDLNVNEIQQNTNNMIVPKSSELENKIFENRSLNCGEMLNKDIESDVSKSSERMANLDLESKLNNTNENEIINTEIYTIIENPDLIGLNKSIYVSETRSSNNFYCQFTDEYDKLGELLNQMTDLYNNLKDKKHSLNKTLFKNNMLIAAKYADDPTWYRGIVCSIDGDNIEVLYIDYGNKEIVKIDDCKELIQRFRVAPHYAHHCVALNRNLQQSILETIQSDFTIIECSFIKLIDNSFEVKLSGDCLLDEEIESNLMQEESETSVSQIEFNESGYVTQIDSNVNQNKSSGLLIDGDIFTNDFNVSNAQTYDEIDDAFNEDSNVNEIQQNSNNMIDVPKSSELESKSFENRSLICGEMLNKKIESDFTNTCDFENKTSETENLIFEEMMNKTIESEVLNNLEFENKTSETISLILNEMLNKTVESDVSKSSERLNNLDLESELNKTNENEIINTEIYTIIENSDLIGLNKSIYICETCPSNSFYCHFTEDYDKLQDLLYQMTDFYNNLKDKKHSLNKTLFKNNMLIAAKYTEDQSWYRGIVCSIDGDNIEVLYIDYGNKEIVNIDDCKELVQQFRDAPHYAHHCSPVNRNMKQSILATIQSDFTIIECNFIKLIDNSFEVKLSGDCLLDEEIESNLMQEESEKLNEETSISHIEFKGSGDVTQINIDSNDLITD